VSYTVEQPLAELGIFREMCVEMQRLRIHRQQAEQGIVHFSDGPGEFMVEFPTDLELFEI
jgi:hypothetical protein